MERKKIVHQLDTPYSTAQWPQISQEDQDAILELLCSLLSPIGQHRKSFIHPSKGKRDRRRKRKGQEPYARPSATPPPPDLARSVDVGLARISRALMEQSAQRRGQGEPPAGPGRSAYAVLFVARSAQCPAFYSHFPQMIATASENAGARGHVRLVGFSKACEDRLASCLGLPRVSCIALREGHHQAQGLIDFVRGRVAHVEAPWLRDAQEARFRGTKINACETIIGTKKARTS